jgi:hypothetical protein
MRNEKEATTSAVAKINIETVLHDTVRQAEDGYIFIDPVCKFFGIQTRNQIARLKADKICQSDMRKNIFKAEFGDTKRHVCVGKRGFLRWIQIINPAILRKDLRDLFEEYQAAVFDYLYSGNEIRTAQLEDIRQYTININHAIRVKQQITDYVTEQKQHRNLCLYNDPTEWARVKPTLQAQKPLPAAVNTLKAISAGLPNNPDELRQMKKNLQTYNTKARNLLEYQSKYKADEPNPMPPGYKREVLNVRIREYQQQIEEINIKLAQVTGKLTINEQEG